MSSLTDSASIFRYHRGMIALHGNGGNAALGWKDLSSQTSRFKVLTAIANLNGRSLLDAGCGHADLLNYLNKLYPLINYIGIEQVPELLDIAIERYANWPEASFIQGNFNTITLPTFDYVLASGSLNYHSNDPEFIFKAISKLFTCCKFGLGFNLLRHIQPNEFIVAYDSDKIMQYCNSLSPNVILKNDYDDEDFTVFMYH